MKVCPNCRQQFADNVMFCPNDGGTLNEQQSEDTLIGRLLEGKYRIEKELGRGGMGTVYRATNTAIERTVAIKVLNPELIANQAAVERFRREARAAGRINHPNAIQVMDFGVTSDRVVFLVMEFLEGRSLRDYLRDKHELSPTETLRIMRPVCAAVDAAHRNGIIHRDLKPDNIMLNRLGDEEVVKVLDFGIAQLKSLGGQNSQHLTQTGMIVGTPYYMSPEQCHAQDLDARSDVYSLGVICYELLTGKLPFTAPTSVGIILKHTSEAPRPLTEISPSVPKAVEEVVLRALEKERFDRQKSAAELAAELEEAVTGQAPVKRGAIPSVEISPAPQTNEALKRGEVSHHINTEIDMEAAQSGVDAPLNTDKIRAADSVMLGHAAPTELLDEGSSPLNYATRPSELLKPPSNARSTSKQGAPPGQDHYQTSFGESAPLSFETRMGSASDTSPVVDIPQVIPDPQVVRPGWTFPLSQISSAERRSRTSFYVSIAAAAAVLIVVSVIGFSWIRSAALKDGPPTTPPVENGPRIPPNMLKIDGGSFTMGRAPAGKEDNFGLAETPAHQVTVDTFYMAKFELTRKEYREFLIATNHAPPQDWNGTNYKPGTDDLPVVYVSWDDAVAYCDWLSERTGMHYRLPTEAEWEYTARGTDGREFPWGDYWDKANSNSKEAGSNSPLPVDRFSDIKSPFGVVNLAGNVSEWTSSDFELYPNSTAKKVDFHGKIIRGGNYRSPELELKTTSRYWGPPNTKEPAYGFRVAMDVPKK